MDKMKTLSSIYWSVLGGGVFVIVFGVAYSHLSFAITGQPSDAVIGIRAVAVGGMFVLLSMIPAKLEETCTVK